MTFLVLAAAAMAHVGPTQLVPLYAPAPGQKIVDVAAFDIDRTPVTNDEFLAFVRRNPAWGRGRVPAIMAEDTYLARWQGPLLPGPRAPGRAPVVEVSWFAAQAYCQERGARLPTEAEWEVAARADATRLDASGDPARAAAILAWYVAPVPAVLPPVGGDAPSVLGLHDMHGLVWEWVLDFGDTEMGPPQASSCAGGATSATSKEDYASFMRYAFRGSLQARYALGSLGFRCARGSEDPR